MINKFCQDILIQVITNKIWLETSQIGNITEGNYDKKFNNLKNN